MELRYNTYNGTIELPLIFFLIFINKHFSFEMVDQVIKWEDHSVSSFLSGCYYSEFSSGLGFFWVCCFSYCVLFERQLHYH